MVTSAQQPFVMVIFGASGDLTRRKLVPALFDLFQAGLLPQAFTVLGYARREWSRDDFIEAAFVNVRLRRGAKSALSRFSRHFEYQQGDFNNSSDYYALAQRLQQLDDKRGVCGQRLLYVATPAESYHTILEGIASAGLQKPCDSQGWTRVVVEKPFGHDLVSAQALDGQLRAIFEENQIYRIDHYLAKETAQNITAFRFANSIFEPIWNSRYVERIEVTMKESIGVGTRGSFYDQTGVLRDVIQNHLLQLLALITMEEPGASAESFRDERAKALSQLRHNIKRTQILLGQYTGYTQEPNVDAKSATPTFARLYLELDGRRWAGTNVVLTAGKALDEAQTAITLVFRPNESNLYQANDSSNIYNTLVFNIQPKEGVELTLFAKSPGYKHQLQPVRMHFDYHENFTQGSIDAYSRLLIDALEGDVTLFARSDEIEAQWKIIDPIVRLAANQKPKPYRQGSTGPSL